MTTATEHAPPPRLRRRPAGRLVAGVASGLADHLGVDVLWVRLAFTLLSGVNGFGLLTYALLWVFTPWAIPDDEPAGLASAQRTGRRPRQGLARGDVGQLVALGAIGLGLVLLLGSTGSGVPARILLPGLVVLGGLALIWAQADASDRERLGSTVRWWGPVTRAAGLLAAARLMGGLVLVVGGLLSFFLSGDQPVDLQSTLAVLLVVLVGAVLAVGPFLWRMGRQVEAERRARLLSQQQADMAAHLHDSVLQTLALIQRKADDPRAVVALARAQERDLRGWLYSGEQAGDQTLKAALEASAAEVEQAHGVPVDVVVVGDAPMDDAGAALVRAAREAMMNAARHSGAPVVDVYAECSQGDDPQVTDVEVFVRDRGIGFDPDVVPDDRMGLRGSIVGRVERHGGRAVVRSAPGEGTEVRLSMSLRRPEQVRA